MNAIANLPAPVRHLILLLAAVLLSWAGTDVVPWLRDQSNIEGATLAAILAAVLAAVTPLVQSYGYTGARPRPVRRGPLGGR